MSLKGFRRKALDLCSYRATSSGFRRCDFQLPPPLDDRFRTFLGVFFISVVSAFIILSIVWSVFRGSFSEDSTSAHCSNSRFSPVFISLLSLLFSWIFFYPQRLSSAEAPETGPLCGGIHNCIEKGLCHEDIAVSVNSMLKSFFTDFIHTQNAPFRWRYEEGLKQILPGTFTIIIK